MADNTFRYGVVLFGASYAPGYVTEPSHVIMVDSLEDVKRVLRNARHGIPWRYDLDGNGDPIKHTPAFGEEGDGGDVFRVQRDDPQFAEVLDEPGDRARHAFAWLDPEPVFRYTFGPRTGLNRERF